METYLRELRKIFRGSRSKQNAHERSRPILQEMSADRAVLTEITRRHLMVSGTLNGRNYPVLGMNVELNPDFHLVANFWIPLPDHRTNLSTKAIHHHGTMLLTTVTSFGPGYEHWVFARPELVDDEERLFELKLTDRSRHALHDVAFVDKYIPHCPFYPSSLTVTYALWTSDKETTWLDLVKRIGPIRKRSAQLKKLAISMGLAHTLDLKVVRDFDYYPCDGAFRPEPERVEFPRGPNEDYLYSLFHVMQQTSNDGMVRTLEEKLASDNEIDNPQLVRALMGELVSGRTIVPRLSEGHYNRERANFTAQQVETVLGVRAHETALSS
jgi:hypothetical protein